MTEQLDKLNAQPGIEVQEACIDGGCHTLRGVDPERVPSIIIQACSEKVVMECLSGPRPGQGHPICGLSNLAKGTVERVIKEPPVQPRPQRQQRKEAWGCQPWQQAKH